MQFVDLFASKQQFPTPPRLVVHPAAGAILRDMAVDQPDFLALDQRISLGDRAFAGAKSLYFGALQLDAGLEPVFDEIVEARPPILGDHFRFVEFLNWWRHLKTVRAELVEALHFLLH